MGSHEFAFSQGQVALLLRPQFSPLSSGLEKDSHLHFQHPVLL